MKVSITVSNIHNLVIGVGSLCTNAFGWVIKLFNARKLWLMNFYLMGTYFISPIWLIVQHNNTCVIPLTLLLNMYHWIVTTIWSTDCNIHWLYYLNWRKCKFCSTIVLYIILYVTTCCIHHCRTTSLVTCCKFQQ